MTVNQNSIPDGKPIEQQQVPLDTISNRNSVVSHEDDLFKFSGMELRPVGEHGLGKASSLRVGMPADGTTGTKALSEQSTQFETSNVAVEAMAPPLDPQHPDLVAPSGVAGAVVGLLLGGPIVAAIAGFGSAYAVRKDGATGDVARALGEVALSVQSTGQEWEEKHHVLGNTKRAIDEADSDLAIKFKALIETSWKAAVELNQQHDLLQRGVEGTGKGFEYLSDKIHSMSKENKATNIRKEEASQMDPTPTDGTFW